MSGFFPTARDVPIGKQESPLKVALGQFKQNQDFPNSLASLTEPEIFSRRFQPNVVAPSVNPLWTPARVVYLKTKTSLATSSPIS